jgi:hypothetical protein
MLFCSIPIRVVFLEGKSGPFARHYLSVCQLGLLCYVRRRCEKVEAVEDVEDLPLEVGLPILSLSLVASSEGGKSDSHARNFWPRFSFITPAWLLAER